MSLKKRFIVKIIRTKRERERERKNCQFIMLWKESKALTSRKGTSERILTHWRFKRTREWQMARLVRY